MGGGSKSFARRIGEILKSFKLKNTFLHTLFSRATLKAVSSSIWISMLLNFLSVPHFCYLFNVSDHVPRTIIILFRNIFSQFPNFVCERAMEIVYCWRKLEKLIWLAFFKSSTWIQGIQFDHTINIFQSWFYFQYTRNWQHFRIRIAVGHPKP